MEFENNFVNFDIFVVIASANRSDIGVAFHMIPLKVYCDQSLELSHRDSSNQGSQHSVRPAHDVPVLNGSPVLSSHIFWVPQTKIQ